MSAKVLRTFALIGVGDAAALRAEERGLPHARGRLRVAAGDALRARAFGPGAPGSDRFGRGETHRDGRDARFALRSRPSERGWTASETRGVA